jgi:hypothetical protein
MMTVAVSSLSTNRTITLPNATGTVALTSSSITGNAATATALQTGRNINGTNFNGTAAITVPGNFTNRTTNESGHLAFIGTTATGNLQMHTNANIRVNPGTGVITATDAVATSDVKLKDNIESLNTEDCLNTILSLRPTSYNWKDGGEFDTGLIAQEVEKVIPHRVHHADTDTLAVSYSKLVTELVGAVQAQNEMINDLKAEIEKLKGEK